ncbi:chorismate--pyruvate lyase family protein [Micromonospora sp. NPDC050417]|uniref:chorismate--pyruvate lyase family protein n=1 Tax=Micromonospora sp. NPDC050417 TaxID=3364280 RepID=UPI00379291D5
MNTASATFAFPIQTRMLLGSEGSTTVLLEALTGRAMRVRVTAQELVAGSDLEPAVCDAINAAPQDRLVLRESVLEAAGATVSVNRVVFAESTAPWLVGDSSDVPIGHQLRGRGALQHRTQLGCGTDVWPYGDSPCAFKCYVIRSSGGHLYVHERFNPLIVPLA